MPNPISSRSSRSLVVRRGWLGLCLILSALVLTSGCSKKEKEPKENIFGKVTIDGKNVAGTVVYVSLADNKEYSVPIKNDGTYRLDNPPQGKFKVLVKSQNTLSGTGPAIPKTSGGPDMTPKIGNQGEDPPAKYATLKTTTLEFEYSGGKVENNLTLDNNK